MTELETFGVGEHPPPYIIFLVVFLFFLTGLLGFLICHLLKKKGYRCRTGDVDDEEVEEEKLEGNAGDEDEENQDTVEQILKCIIENEANMEAFNEMLGNHNVCVRHDPRLRKESIGGVPSHHHTVHSGTDHNSCHLCAQGRSKKGRRQSRISRSKQRPGEQTVFSVGRFRVIHTDKKLHGSPNPLTISGDQLEQSQDNEERKEDGYNLRSMFKEVRLPSESANGVTLKRKKSVTIFGLARGSDPIATKSGEGAVSETGGVKCAIQQQPVVLEETLQQENTEVGPECGTKPGPSPKSEPASLLQEAKTPGSVNSPSFQSKKLAHDPSSGLEEGSKPKSSTEPHSKIMINPSVGSTTASAPSSLTIPLYKRVNVEDKELKNKEVYSPGPLQTSTPIAPIPGSITSFPPVISTSQPETYSRTGVPVTQTPPDPIYSPDLEPGSGASLALISLGSSPPSSFPIKTPSSASPLKTPISPLSLTPSPKLSSINIPSEGSKIVISPALSLNQKISPGQEIVLQSPNSSSSVGESANPLQDQSPSLALTTGPKLDAFQVSLQTPSSSPTDQTEIKRVGILKTTTFSAVVPEDSKGSAFYSSSNVFKDSLSNLPLLSSSPLSPSSPQASRISSVTIVKASPDSKREFSVVTMVKEEKSSTSIQDHKGETSELGTKSEKGILTPAVGQGEEVSFLGASGVEIRPTLSQEKDDMMEMDDIRDCKVMQEERTDRMEEDEEKTVYTRPKK